MNYMVPLERATLITGGNAALLMKNTVPKYINPSATTLMEKVSVKFIFDNEFYNTSRLLKMRMVSFANGDKSAYPFVKLNLRDAADNSEVNTKYEIGLSQQIFSNDGVKVKGTVPVILSWKIQEKHMRVHR